MNLLYLNEVLTAMFPEFTGFKPFMMSADCVGYVTVGDEKREVRLDALDGYTNMLKEKLVLYGIKKVQEAIA